MIDPISTGVGGMSGFAPYGVGAGFNLPGSFPLAAPSSSTSAADPSLTAPVQGTGSFGTMLADKLGELDALHAKADDLSVKAMTGDLQDVHEYTIAANEAQLATQLTVQLRNKAVDAFTEIMRMPL